MPFKVSDDICRSIETIVDHFDNEDRTVRDRQIRMWRKLKLYWESDNNIYWDDVAHDWRNIDTEQSGDYQSGWYDKQINVFRAYLESIISALSVLIPPVRCIPDDAQDDLDLSTAKTGNKISELIDKHNKAPLLWLHALFIYCTEGMIACHNYTKKSKEYGTYKEEEYKNVDKTSRFCPECEGDVNEFLTNQPAPVESDPLDGLNPLEVEPLLCPECQAPLDPSIQESTIQIPVLVDITDQPKSRQILDVYGGLYVKVPNFARNQEECPYLRLENEVHFTTMLEEFPDLADMEGKDWSSETGYESGGPNEPYETWGRLSPQYRNEYPNNTITIKRYWLRPCSYYILEKKKREEVFRLFPDGVKVQFANDEMAEDPIAEKLDDHWTLTRNPLSDYVHFDPLGSLLTSVQDITVELISLTLATIEHGIPQTFVDTAVVNLKLYGQMENAPGSMIPAKAQSGKSLGDGFHEIKTASLSGEVGPFGQNIQDLGQLASGSTPAIFGGDQSGAGGETASGYAQSKAQALQRLQTPWKMLLAWWETIHGKVIPAYIENMMEDEVLVEKTEDGNFANVYLRKVELAGKIGSVECEASDQLPITWGQKRDALMKLMELNQPAILEALASPENLQFLAESIGLNDFLIPGLADRQKQYEEIKQLLASDPMPDPMDPLGQKMIPSVMPDVDVDNHQIEAEICRVWLVSETGRLAKTDNPAGYKNVLLHMRAHQEIMQALMQQQALIEPSNEGEETIQ